MWFTGEQRRLDRGESLALPLIARSRPAGRKEGGPGEVRIAEPKADSAALLAATFVRPALISIILFRISPASRSPVQPVFRAVHLRKRA